MTDGNTSLRSVIELVPENRIASTLVTFYNFLILTISGGFLSMNFFLTLRGEEIIAGSAIAGLFFVVHMMLVPVINAYGTMSNQVETFPPSGREDSDYLINVETTLKITLVVLMLLTLAIWELHLGCVLMDMHGFPLWLLGDSFVGFWGAFFLWLWIDCWYRINPRDKTILFAYSNPFYRERREIRFEEIIGVTVGGEERGIPIVLPLHMQSFHLQLIFSDGRVLPLPPLTGKGKSLSGTLRDYHDEADAIAKILNCRAFSDALQSQDSFETWVRDVREIGSRAQNPEEVKTALWEAAMGSASLGIVAPGLVKLDLSTLREKAVLVLILLLLGLTTFVFLSYEWAYLASNPRFFYLILLDCSSILATVVGLWRLFIDEYYVIDLDREEIRFFSRILFYRSEYLVLPFNDIRSVSVRETGQNSKAPELALFLETRYGNVEQISDSMLDTDLLTFRGTALAHLLKVRFSPREK